MKIGIDIDDTVVETLKSVIKYADIYDKEVLDGLGINGNLGLIQESYYLQALYGWSEEIVQDFFNAYYQSILEECSIKPNVSSVINKLKEEGNDIIFVTARITSNIRCHTEIITKKTFTNNNVPYDKIIFNSSSKLQPCLDNDIKIFIDDSYEVCKELHDNGIKVFLMTSIANRNIDAKDIERVNNWEEIYEKINNYLLENVNI